MRIVSTVVLLTFLVIHSSFGQSDFYSKRWSRVYQHELKELPKSALQIVDTIYIRAKREKNMQQLTKAMIYQSKFALTLSEDAELLITQKFEIEIRSAKAPLRNILESLLANIYWEYFQQKRSTYYERSRTAKKEDTDFRLWDSPAMLNEIHMHYQRSLHDKELLQKNNLTNINELLIQAEGSKTYRPTLYDFLAHNALDFYEMNERDILSPALHFVLNDSLYFSDYDRIALAQQDTTSSEYQALLIYQSLLSFHKTDSDPGAFIHNELELLQLLVSKGDFQNETELHKRALTKLKAAYQKYSASTLIDFQLASLLHREASDYDVKTKKNQFKKQEALLVCEKAIAAFPKSEGSLQCLALRNEILNQQLDITAEKFVPIDKLSRLLVSYTNIDSLSFSAFSISPAFEREFYSPMSDSLRLAKLNTLTPGLQWRIPLPDLKDHRQHRTEVLLPQLKKGNYLVVARTLHPATSTPVLFAYSLIQATNLALIENSFENIVRYQVVDRNNGAPLEGASVHLKSDVRNPSYESLDKTFTTDKNGFFEFKRQKNKTYNILATVDYKDDHATFGGYYVYQAFDKQEERDQPITAKAFLFSDRSIYRPGQTVFFKGILVKTKGKKSSLVTGEYVEVTLNDENYEEVGLLRLKTNSYGSFSGEFKLPSNGLTGEYSLNADEDDEGESKFYDNLDDFYDSDLEISVEEYKRPTFEVLFKPVDGSFKLNDSIVVRGTAKTFAGANISGAKVSYHVKRNVRYPQWNGWGRRNFYSNEKELDEDETITDGDGAFSITFKAEPDESVSKKEKPVFEFEITADVTDINGETRSSSTTVKVGYQSVVAKINSPLSYNRKISDNSFTVSIENLNGQPLSRKGTITIYKIKSSPLPLRPRPWAAPDIQQFSEEEFSKLFPNDPYQDAKESQGPDEGKQMLQLPFNTATSSEVKFKLDKGWALGAYYIELMTADEKGDSVVTQHKFDLEDPGVNQVADQLILVSELDKSFYRVGEVAHVKIGSASKDITVVIDVEKNNKIIKTYTRHLSGNYTEIQIPITEGENDNVLVHYQAASYNAFFNEKRKIVVDNSKKKMEIETISFKDKLQPGGKETWSFEIKGTDPLKKEVEVLASMYDASLDQFKKHQWSFDPMERSYQYSSTRVSFDESFGVKDFIVKNPTHRYYQTSRLYFDQFDDFGFSITGRKSINDRYLARLYTGDALNNSKVVESNNRKVKKGYITGRITSEEDGSPLPGVNVLIKGTTEGTVTDAEGRYLLQADKGDELVFSFIGLSTAEVKVAKKNTIDVMMAQDVTQLTEVVVTAQGIARDQKALGYSISYITDNDKDEVYFNFDLKGKVPGLQILNASGSGAPGQLLIRGAASLDSLRIPLYVVDGAIVAESKIDKDDLESVQVLKGGAATALYGSQAANGVIIITTKSGQKRIEEELAKVNVRKNFNETAFFFPHLITDENGRIQFTFTTPESLTRWKLQLMAHNRELESATKILNAMTQKDFMVTPNPPRFLRAGDEIIFSAKIISLTGSDLFGNTTLQLTNAVTRESVDKLFENQIRNKSFKVSAKGNTQVTWKLKIPAGIDAVQYKVIAKAGNFSDGEQNALPVLSNRILVTETLPMSIRAGETKSFSLEKLKSNTSTTLQNHQLTLEVTSNPAWYAVQALPYLMEFPHECSEQTFARYYANTLASYIANSNPKIKEVFEKWASSNALISNLEKNAELKSTIIQETPWLRDAQSETEQKKRIALLFDLNTMKNQQEIALAKLQQLQLSDGGFTWFAGGRYSSRYITEHIASGFGHLRTLKVVNEKDPFLPTVVKAIAFLDNEIARDYKQLLEQAASVKSNEASSREGEKLAKEFLAKQHVWNDQLHYLYIRSFYPDIKIPESAAAAVSYYKNQSAQNWKSFNLYLKGMIALIQYREHNTKLATDILRALKENSIVSEEMGMYWMENKAGWYWHEAPVETQALLIEAFNEIEFGDKDKQKTIDELRIWLLKNKQTSQWQTTKATTEAIYALLLNGTEWLTLNDKIEISVGGKKVIPPQQSVEAGTGYFKTSWKGNAVTPDMNKVKMTKKGEGIAWAGLYWQYFEDIDKITGAETPLKLSKKIFVVSRDAKGELLNEIDPDKPIAIGSLLRIRIELKADREMEFLHLKDMRAAGLEPVDVLSEYKWQNNLGYYQSTKDASTNFFFDSIAKGVYVFEYGLRVNNKGNFSNGIATIQSMYAPEFSSHSEGSRIKVE